MEGDRHDLAVQTKFDAWFVHPKLGLGLLDDESARRVGSRLPSPDHPMWRSFHMNAMEQALADALVALQPTSVSVGLLAGTLSIGQLVWADQRFYYNGVAKAVSQFRAGRPGRGRFHAPLSTDDGVEVSGDFNVEHLTSSTSVNELSGKGTHFILGYIKSLADVEVVVRPILIADRWGRGVRKPGQGFVETEPQHVWPSQVDQFAGVDWSVHLRSKDLDVLRSVPEQQVKVWLAEIFGEPTLPKDWGGEQFDLWTDRITIGGTRVRAAFALKGPARFHPMTVADLGKNGDQIERLANTVADLLVVQHCHKISAQVESTLRAFAVDPANPRRYMTIDGYNTIRILRHFGYL